ncbi:hypothetical protein K438DRAFT_1571435 [Mycena galopus ATCC 62051]|nr:hypothetical protein K438DRAFT_1571435 [Mycena galopus ATCC 62051]
MNRAKLNRANPQSPGVVDRVSEALHAICWSEQIMGFSNTEPIAALSLYASRNWFSDVQQSHMLDLLQMDVLDAGRALKDEVCEIWMVEYIRAGWRQRAKYESPGTSKDFPRAKQIGAALSSGARERFGMIGNLQNRHWIAVVVDCKEGRLLYGDPFKLERDAETEKALEWWTEHHTGRRFSWDTLEVPDQKDGFNCGILSHSSLSHCFLPNIPLTSGDGTGPADARLEMMLRVIKRHLDVSVE